MATNPQTNVLLDPFDPTTATGVAANLDLRDVDIELRYQWAISAVRGPRNLSSRRAAALYRLCRSTLDSRLLGVKSRQEAHKHQRALSPAQEAVLVEWVKVPTITLITRLRLNVIFKIMGRRGLPLSLETIGKYAADIAGAPVGDTWPRRFRVTSSINTWRLG